MQSVNRTKERRRRGIGPGLDAELSATLALAAPLAAGNLAQMAMSVTTTVMVGRLGGMPLAAVGLGAARRACREPRRDRPDFAPRRADRRHARDRNRPVPDHQRADGLLGASALAAHQLVLNCAGVTFMVPLGLANAATVRVALQLGADRAAAARRAGFVAVALGIAFMSATAIVLWTVPGPIIGLYIDTGDPANRAIVAIARRLFAIAALFQVFDGVQVIAAGALRGHKDAMVPLLLATIGYWGWVSPAAGCSRSRSATARSDCGAGSRSGLPPLPCC
jgi:Na+-driven multidrug efflux pump